MRNSSILMLQNPIFMIMESNLTLVLMEVNLSETRTLDMAQFLLVIIKVL